LFNVFIIPSAPFHTLFRLYCFVSPCQKATNTDLDEKQHTIVQLLLATNKTGTIYNLAMVTMSKHRMALTVANGNSGESIGSSSPSPRPRQSHASNKRSSGSVTKTMAFCTIIPLVLLLVAFFLRDTFYARNLRWSTTATSTTWESSLVSSKQQQPIDDQKVSVPPTSSSSSSLFEDFYFPYNRDSENLSALFPHCDLLPLAGGHNSWHSETGEAIRLHQHASHICGPKVLVVGAMKCGTNTIGHLLAKHPRVKINTCPVARTAYIQNAVIDTKCNDAEFQGRHDEIWEGHDMSIQQIFNPNWMADWTKRLPWTTGTHNITIDKSPSYMNVVEFPNITHDAKRLLPNAKIVVSVCNPALRLYSEYNHNMDQRAEGFLEFYRDKEGVTVPTDFGSFVDLLFSPPTSNVCRITPHFCTRNQIFYLHKGEYSTLLKEWYAAFGRDNVLVVDMNDNQKNIATELLDLVGHHVLPPEEYPWEEVSQENPEIDFKSAAVNYTGRSSAYTEYPEHIVQLEQYFAPFNKELAELIGRDFPLQWNQRLEDAFRQARQKNRKKQPE
jgi:hypothetical protein